MSGWSVVGSLAPSVPISFGLTVSIKIYLGVYRRQIIVFANINFSHSRGRGKVQFSCERATYRSSAVASEIKNLQNGPVSLTGGNLDTDIVDEICLKVPPGLYSNFNSATQNNQEIKVKFDGEVYRCIVY